MYGKMKLCRCGFFNEAISLKRGNKLFCLASLVFTPWVIRHSDFSPNIYNNLCPPNKMASETVEWSIKFESIISLKFQVRSKNKIKCIYICMQLTLFLWRTCSSTALALEPVFFFITKQIRIHVEYMGIQEWY